MVVDIHQHSYVRNHTVSVCVCVCVSVCKREKETETMREKERGREREEERRNDYLSRSVPVLPSVHLWIWLKKVPSFCKETVRENVTTPTFATPLPTLLAAPTLPH